MERALASWLKAADELSKVNPMHDDTQSALFQLIYESEANSDFSESEISQLLNDSRKANGRWGITGILLYRQRRFTQVLEGDETRVRQLFEKIRQDRRHRNVCVRLEQPIEVRSFPNWSMGYSRRDLSDFS